METLARLFILNTVIGIICTILIIIPLLAILVIKSRKTHEGLDNVIDNIEHWE